MKRKLLIPFFEKPVAGANLHPTRDLDFKPRKKFTVAGLSGINTVCFHYNPKMWSDRQKDILARLADKAISNPLTICAREVELFHRVFWEDMYRTIIDPKNHFCNSGIRKFPDKWWCAMMDMHEMGLLDKIYCLKVVYPSFRFSNKRRKES